ncbi:probable E3 ubiquitin-protein ligase RHG1A [Salvia splendens]|nr:probable E3 ubiquitin-protein ligase RHG1A [Salvia splendens]
MDETETDGLESEESSTTIWWPSSMGEVIVALPAAELHAQYSNYFVPVFPNPTPPPSRHPSQGDVLSGFKTRRCCDDTDQHEEEVCCICLDKLYRGSVTTLDCSHEFHPDCIRRWLVDGQNFCPLCKAPAIM